MQRELADRLAFARALVASHPRIAPRVPVLEGAPTPVHYVVLGGADEAIEATAALLARGFLVNPVAFPAVPMRAGGIRFTIGRCHTDDDVRALVAAIADMVPARRDAAVEATAPA